MGSFSLALDTSSMQTRLKELQRLDKKAFKTAAERAAIQFLTWANAGSAKSSKKPPIRFGVLRGSSSAFLGSRLLLAYPQQIRPGSNEVPTPAQECDERNELTATWAWNTSYATFMHEGVYELGQYSEQDGNAGPKWLEAHLQADAEDWLSVIAEEFSSELGTK